MEDKNKCQLCEEIKKDRKFPSDFGNILNAIALALIVIIIGLFFYLMFPSKEIAYKKGTDIKISLVKSNTKKLDSVTFNKIVDLKFKEFEEKIEKIEKKRTEDLKYYGTLLGFVFSIIGFFGFKSIHDTRQSAIERAVTEAKSEAVKEAREASKNEAKIASITEARSIAETTTKKDAESTAKETSKNETIKFLSDEFPKQFRIQEENYTSTFTEDLEKISKDVDRLKNPEAYGDRNKTEIKIQEDLVNLKNKYDEILEIIYKIKIKILEDEKSK